MSEERAVLVTGANSGIGLATVLELAARGFRSIGTVRSEAKAATVHDAARERGVEVETRLLEVTDASACEALLEELPLYGLVNNAGYALTGAVEDVSDDEARRLFETMVFAPMRLARLALPGMRARGGGRIVNISSVYGLTTSPLTGWYQGAKHALEGLSDALRMEVAQDGIAVILVEPGGFRTAIWDELESGVEQRPGSRYQAAYARAERALRWGNPLMGDPATCAGTIAGALDARFPRARYLVGLDARLLSAAQQLTPTSIRDRVTRFLQGL